LERERAFRNGNSGGPWGWVWRMAGSAGLRAQTRKAGRLRLKVAGGMDAAAAAL
jgi:hypothetical protein